VLERIRAIEGPARPSRSSRLEAYALRRIPFDESTAEQPVEVLALAAGQGPKRRFEDLADNSIALAERRLATRGELMSDRPTWASHAFDHPELEKAIGQRTKRLIGLERHYSKSVRRRVRARGNRAKGVPLGQRRADFSQLAVHAPVVAVLELLDRSAYVLEGDGHAVKITSQI
jgi:hypothetical protein